jgi:hypothetical protein
MKPRKHKRRIDRNRAALVRELRTTGYPEKSIYRWINADSGPRDPHGRKAWESAVAVAKAKIARAAS